MLLRIIYKIECDVCSKMSGFIMSKYKKFCD